MINKQQIKTLKLKSEFNYVFSNIYKKINSNIITIIIAYNQNNKINLKQSKIGIICNKKFHKNAVIRNRAKRIIKEAIKNIVISNILFNKTFIFIPKKDIIKLKMNDVKQQILNMLIL